MRQRALKVNVSPLSVVLLYKHCHARESSFHIFEGDGTNVPLMSVCFDSLVPAHVIHCINQL